MSRHKKKHAAPVPPGNQSRQQSVTGGQSETPDRHEPTTGASFQEQDAERRLGGFTGRGEHSRQQPGRANDGDVHSS